LAIDDFRLGRGPFDQRALRGPQPDCGNDFHGDSSPLWHAQFAAFKGDTIAA
jgi:hypothetical protein